MSVHVRMSMATFSTLQKCHSQGPSLKQTTKTSSSNNKQNEQTNQTSVVSTSAPSLKALLKSLRNLYLGKFDGCVKPKWHQNKSPWHIKLKPSICHPAPHIHRVINPQISQKLGNGTSHPSSDSPVRVCASAILWDLASLLGAKGVMKVDDGGTQRRTHSRESWWHSGYQQPGVERHQARHSGFEALPGGLSVGKSCGSLAPGWQGFYLFTVIVDEPSHLRHEEPGRQAASDDILYNVATIRLCVFFLILTPPHKQKWNDYFI